MPATASEEDDRAISIGRNGGAYFTTGGPALTAAFPVNVIAGVVTMDGRFGASTAFAPDAVEALPLPMKDMAGVLSMCGNPGCSLFVAPEPVEVLALPVNDIGGVVTVAGSGAPIPVLAGSAANAMAQEAILRPVLPADFMDSAAHHLPVVLLGNADFMLLRVAAPAGAAGGVAPTAPQAGVSVVFGPAVVSAAGRGPSTSRLNGVPGFAW